MIGKNSLGSIGLLLFNYLIILELKKIQREWTYEDIIICHFWSSHSCNSPTCAYEL
jgi:hypothetical protein